MKRFRLTRGLALVIGATAIWLLTTQSVAGFTAQLTNNSSNAGTTSSLLTATDTASSTVDCSSNVSPISATQTIPCVGSALAASVASSGTSSHQLTFTASGGVSPASATYAATSCGPVQLSDQSTSADPMLPRGGVTYAQTGPLTGSNGLGLDGSTALATDVASTSATALGNSFTEGVWFKTAAGYSGGGTLIGFGSSPSAVGDTTSDKVLSLTTAGKVQFAINSTLGLSLMTSSNAFNDGQWHFAAVSVASVLGLLVGVTVYVDGTQVASQLNVTLAAGYTGYWHVGWSPVSSGSPYLTGSVADAFVVDGTALSATAISNLAGAGSQTAWNSDLGSAGASQSWALGDSGTTTYTGTLPVLGSTSPCTMVSVAVGSTSFCVYSPNSTSGGCPTPTASSVSLAQWVAAGALSFPATVIGSPAVITTTVIRSSTYNTTFVPGLHLYVPVIVTERLTATSSWYTKLTWSSVNEQVIA